MPAAIALFLFLSGVLPVRAQDVSVRASFDTTRILIGDQIGFTVTVEQPAGLTLSIPVLKDTLIKNIEILKGPARDSASIAGEKIRITEKYIITSFDSGYYRVNPVYVELNDASGLKRYYSDYSILEVARIRLTPPDTSTKIFDIVAPYKAPVTLGEILPFILIAMCVAAVSWFLVKFLKKFKKGKKEVQVPEIREPAHIIALRELEKLRDEKLWQSNETKKYYTRLTEIVRQYLENRYRVYSLELTTSETLEALIKTGFRKDESYNRLKSVLNAADLVKFAKYKPDPVENDTVFTNSWDFVLATKQTDAGDTADSNKDKTGGMKS